MKLGFVTAILPDLSLQEVLEFAAADDSERLPPGVCQIVGPGKLDVEPVDELTL